MITVNMPKAGGVSTTELCRDCAGRVFIGENCTTTAKLFMIVDNAVFDLQRPLVMWTRDVCPDATFIIHRFVDLEINVKEKGD